MKTTLEIPDEIYRQTKSAAALRGESVKEFVNQAIRLHLERTAAAAAQGAEAGWRRVFGSVPPSAVREVDRAIEEEFSQVDPADWT